MKQRILSLLVALLALTTQAWAKLPTFEKTIFETTETLSTPIYVIENTEITIADGVTLTINDGLTIAEGKTLTVKGKGTLVVNGKAGEKGEDSTTDNAGSGYPGGAAVTGNIIIQGVTVIATGGTGGNGGVTEIGNGGNGGDGGYAFAGTLTFKGGAVTAIGGDGGSCGHGYDWNGLAGNAGKAFSKAVNFQTTYTMKDGNETEIESVADQYKVIITEVITFDYEFTDVATDHGSGQVKFFIGSEEVEGAYEADEGKTVTVTIAPDEGWIVDEDNVTAEVYRYWEGSRRAQALTVPMQRTIPLTYVKRENGVFTYTFEMPASSVKVKAEYLKSSTLYFDPAGKTNLMEIKVNDDKVNVEDGKTVKIEKVEKVTEGTPVKLTANTGYKFRKVEVKKGAPAAPEKPEYADNAEELSADTRLHTRSDLVSNGNWLWNPTYTADQAQAVANYYAAITGTKCAVIYGHGDPANFTVIYYVTSDNGVSGTVYRNESLSNKFPGYKVYLLK